MFAKRIKKFRQNANLTQQQLAEKLGITQATITKYETGKAEPGRDVLIKMAECFNCTTDYLLGRTNHPNDRTVDLPENLRKLGALEAVIEGGEISPEDIRMIEKVSRVLRRLRIIDPEDEDGNGGGEGKK